LSTFNFVDFNIHASFDSRGGFRNIIVDKNERSPDNKKEKRHFRKRLKNDKDAGLQIWDENTISPFGYCPIHNF